MTTRGFYSAVQHRDDPELIMLRARCQKDLLALQELLPELEPYSELGSDYAWRAVISQKNWQHALTQLAAEIDYPNFKRKKQEGNESFYKKRGKKDGQIDINKSIIEQFNLLRIGNNVGWPSHFQIDGQAYILKIYKDEN